MTNKNLLRITCLILGIPTVLSGLAHAATAIRNDSISTIVGATSGLCLGVKGSSTAAGAQLQSQTCVASDFQKWKFVQDSAGYFEVVNLGSGQCIDVTGGSPANGVVLQQWYCSGGDFQKWNFGDQGAGQFAIVSKYNHLALGKDNAGTNVTQWTWLAAPNQKWTVPNGQPRAGLPASGSIITLTDVKSGYCLGVENSSKNFGAKLQTQACNNASTFQQWKVTADAAGDYLIANVGSDECIDVPGAAHSRAVLQQWGCTDAAWQKWQFRDDGAGHYYITSAVSGLALHEASAGAPGGVDQSVYQNAPSQQWSVAIVGAQKAPGTGPIGFGAGTTGGSAPVHEDVTVTNPKDLAKALCSRYYGGYCSDDTPRIIRISGTLDFRGTEGTASAPGCVNTRYQCVSAGGRQGKLLNAQNQCTDLKLPMSPVSYDKAATTPLMVGSNKTIYGVGANSGIKGKGFRLINVSNVIIRNLSITDLNDGVVWAGDGITIDDSHHVVIDHILTRGMGRQAIVSGSGNSLVQNITISNNYFDGTSDYGYLCDGRAYYIVLLGGRDKTVTLVGNRFHSSSGRSPEIGGNGVVHLVNNYYDNNAWTGGLSGTNEVAVLVEGNYFAHGTDNYTPIADQTFGKTDTNSNWNFAPIASNLAAANKSCLSVLGRNCSANVDQANFGGASNFLLNPAVMATIQSTMSAAPVIKSVAPADPLTLPTRQYGPRADIQP